MINSNNTLLPDTEVSCCNFEELNGYSSKYIFIPQEVILDVDIDIKRIMIYIFITVRRGLDDRVIFNIDDMITWCGYKPDTKKEGITNCFKNILNYYNSIGLITINSCINKSYYITFNKDIADSYCDDLNTRFAIVYLDEIESIRKSSIRNISALMLTFVYLRMQIRTRTFKTFNEYKLNAIKSPEVYVSTYYSIADILGISKNTIGNILDDLQNNFNLIYKEHLYPNKENGIIKQSKTIFTNMYKRYDNKLISYGDEYYRREVECEKLILKKLYKFVNK